MRQEDRRKETKKKKKNDIKSVCVCVCVCVSVRFCYATNKICSFSCMYKDGSVILKVMRSELNSLNVIEIVDGKKNVKRVKIRNEIKERRRQIIPRSVPRGRFDYCSVQILIL
jgi:hypothetical protein